MERHSVFVTGANRGIGLEFVRQLTQLPVPPHIIFATYRSAEKLEALKEIKNSSEKCTVELIKMDVQNAEEVAAARKIVERIVGENGLTLLINNAAIFVREAFPNVTEENLIKHFSVNTIGPIRVLQEMLPLLKKAAERNVKTGGQNASMVAVLNITARIASIKNTGAELQVDLAVPAYKISKCALQMAMKVFSVALKDEGILIVSMCPGWVKTDMGGENAEITPQESVSALLQTLDKLDASHHGSFMDRFGNPYPF